MAFSAVTADFRWTDEIIARCGALLLRVLASSCRFKHEREPGAAEAFSSPYVLAFWHDQQLMMPFAWKKFRTNEAGIHALISQHRDGRRIARAMDLVGINSVAGSSTRGGARALLEMVKIIRAGGNIAITPDGPKGPRHVAKQGAVDLARHAKAPILPVATVFGQCWRFNSWDKMAIPRPWTTISSVVGSPLDGETTIDALSAELSRLTQKAEELLRHDA